MRKRSSKRATRPKTPSNETAGDAVLRLSQSIDGGADVSEIRSQAAAMLGSLGGKKGGPARAKALSAARRKRIAQIAARARWEREVE